MKRSTVLARRLTGTTRLLILAGGLLAVVTVIAALLLTPSEPRRDSATRVTAPESPPQTSTAHPSVPSISVAPKHDYGPHTLDHRALSESTVIALYTWDARTSDYTEIYARVRSWWMVLEDGSNPLSVYTAQFEGTGIDAAAFVQLTSRQAHRTSNLMQTKCDAELANYVEHPAPWEGLHVCTVTVSVTDRSTSDTGSAPYTVPVSVVANCPPAASAPYDRCALVAFYTDADRIVY
ncbi:hypothetical protein [Pseudarthrobacter sp. MDT1-22]